MTVDQLATALFGAAIGFAVTRSLIPLRIRTAPKRLMRVNVSGLDVPAVLGGPLGIGAMGGLLAIVILGATGWEAARAGRVPAAVAAAFVIMHIVGRIDDLRGDESDRGFRGHLGAAKGRRLTGGMVKIAGGLIAGIACAAILATYKLPGLFSEGVSVHWPAAIALATFVPLTANLINLLDRAPGRALKVVFLIGVPVAALGNPFWAVAAAPTLGAAVGTFPEDVRERAMLGDAGSNPLGAVLGLGLVLALPGYGWWVVGGIVLLGLNLASERWSFSRIVENNRVLSAFDRWGRQPVEPRE